MNIDWSKAPEWAVAHGLHETGLGIKEFWLGETQHQNREHEKSFLYGGGDPSCGSFRNSKRESFSYVTPRPAPWTGEGLPPVGTVCEFKTYGRNAEWSEVEIIAHFRNNAPVAAFIQTGDGHKTVNQAIAECFRPIRSTEQIAADERESGVAKMLELVNYAPHTLKQYRDIAEHLWDAGYRKQVQP